MDTLIIDASGDASYMRSTHVHKKQNAIDQLMKCCGDTNRCHFCNTIFSRRGNLRRHVDNMHYKRASDRCPMECGFRAVNSDIMGEHVRVCHPGQFMML